MRKFKKRIVAAVMALAMAVGSIATGSITVKAATTVPTVKYHVHIQSYGDKQGWKSNGATAGTMGEAKRLEQIQIQVEGNSNLGVEYRTHIQSYGWEKSWSKDGAKSGTAGQFKRLEAIQIRLTGADASKYDIYYRVHAQTYGWLGWAKNGQYAGTAGQSKRLEGIQIKIVKKGDYPTDGSLGCAFVDLGKKPSIAANGIVNYTTHVQTYKDQAEVADGSVSGTFGEAKRLEAIKIKLDKSKLDIPNLSGGITYRTHIQSYGWEKSWSKDGAKSGTTGQSKRLEAIQIKLTGEVAKYYDVYYRVHAQSYGWLSWAKNGEASGTAGYGKRLEGIQIVVVPKGTAAPNSLPASQKVSYVSKTNEAVDGAAKEVKITNFNIGTDKEIKAGESVAFTPTFEPADATNQRIVYTSSNENVAVVDNKGNVTAVGDGTATITATTTDGSNLSKSITVTVTSTVLPTKITVDPSYVEMTIGGDTHTRQIVATVTPSNATDKSLNYESMDPTVATVDKNGVITAVGRGTTQIKVISVANPTVENAVTVKVFDYVDTKVIVKHGTSATITIDAINGAQVVKDLDEAVTQCKEQLTALEGSDWTVRDVNAGNVVYTVKYTDGVIHYFNEGNEEVDHLVVAQRLQGCEITVKAPVSSDRVDTLFATLETLQDYSGYAQGGKSYTYGVTLIKDTSHTLSNLTLGKQYTTFEADGISYKVYMEQKCMFVVGDVTESGIFKAMADDGLIEFEICY